MLPLKATAIRLAFAVALVTLLISCADVQCKLNSDCANMEHCSAQNTCVTECLAQRDCLAGQVCTINGVCVSTTDGEVTEPQDAASDDVPRPDVPVVDTGIDVHVTTVNDTGVDTGMDAGTDTGLFLTDVGMDGEMDVPLPPVDVPIDTGVDVPRDTGIDVPLDVGVDVPARDLPVDTGALADAGAVGVGFYTFTGVDPPAGMVDPVAVTWHPSGSYALILAYTNNVYRYNAVTRTVTAVTSPTSGINWRMGAFTPDGTMAFLIGSTYASSTSTYEGHIYAWTDATSTLAELTAEQWTGGSYQSIRFAPDGSQAALLGQGDGMAYVTYIWFLSTAGHRTGIAAARGMVPETGCNDISWTTDGFGSPAIDLACGYDIGEIDRVTNLGASSGATFTTVASSGETGNVSAIAGTLGGSIELAVGSASSQLFRMTGGLWSAGFLAPSIPRAAGVSFDDNGTRAFAFGGPGDLYEYRTDVFTMAGITPTQIPITMPPYEQPSGAVLQDVQWRPGCDEGLAVGGEDTFEGTSSFIAYFAAMNGRMCSD